MFQKSKIFLLGAFVALTGVQAPQQDPSNSSADANTACSCGANCPCAAKNQEHKVVIGSYPDHMPAIPSGSRVVLAGGTFDLIHHNYTRLLKEAKAQGNYLVALVESDDFIRKVKHREPIHTQEQRAEMVAHLHEVDAIVNLPPMKGYDEYLKLVQKIHPQVIVAKITDAHLADMEKQAAEVGATVTTVLTDPHLSSEEIQKDLCKGKSDI